MSTEQRLAPATSVVHLEYNAGEDVAVELTVVDDSTPPQPVPIVSAIGTIGIPGCPDRLHLWTVAGGNLTVLDQALRPGGVILHSSRADTAAWARWGDAEWQLDVVDLFDRSKRACEGDVRVNPTRAEVAP